MTTEAKAPTFDAESVGALFASMEARLTQVETRLDTELAEIKDQLPDNRLSMVVFSGDLDKTLAAFIIATGAAAMGMEVSMFFTFWGLSAIKAHRSVTGKSLPEAMMAVMTAGSSKELSPSKMAYFGAGSLMLRQMMKDKDVQSLEELIVLAKELGVRIVACDMSMDVMGVRQDELMPGVDLGGVATFLGDAAKSKVSLFI